MSINNRLVNAGGLPPQPEGTGALVGTSQTGIYISVDDGVTWDDSAITGLPSYKDFRTTVCYNGTNFVTAQRTYELGSANQDIYISPDGYNWTVAQNIPYEIVGGIDHDPINNETVLTAWKQGSPYNTWNVYSSFDGGLTWTGSIERSSQYYGSSVGDVTVHNGAVQVVASGNYWRDTLGGNFGWTNTSPKPACTVYNNGNWVGFRSWYLERGLKQTTTSPGSYNTWTITSLSGSDFVNAYALRNQGTDIWFSCFRTGSIQRPRVYRSTDGGTSFQQMFQFGSANNVGGRLIEHNGNMIFIGGQTVYSWDGSALNNLGTTGVDLTSIASINHIGK